MSAFVNGSLSCWVELGLANGKAQQVLKGAERKMTDGKSAPRRGLALASLLAPVFLLVQIGVPPIDATLESLTMEETVL